MSNVYIVTRTCDIGEDTPVAFNAMEKAIDYLRQEVTEEIDYAVKAYLPYPSCVTLEYANGTYNNFNIMLLNTETLKMQSVPLTEEDWYYIARRGE